MDADGLVIFDCDGVLVDSEWISTGALAGLLGDMGHEITEAESHRIFTGTWWPDTQKLIEGRIGEPLPDDFATRFRERQMAALAADGVKPVPGVVAVLDGLTQRTCVASNGPQEKMRLTLGSAGLLDRFDGRIFSAYDVERGKPEPDLFLHAAERMGAAPERSAVIEDSVHGVMAARRAGMHVFAYCAESDPVELAEAGAVVFDAMHELPALLHAVR